MRNIVWFTSAVAAGVLVLSQLAVPVTAHAADWKAAKVVWPSPMLRAGSAKQISEHVYIMPDNNIPAVPNVGFIIGPKGTLVIDPGFAKANGEIVLKELNRIIPNGPPVTVTATHYHPDHVLGFLAFPPETPFIVSSALQQDMTDHGAQIISDFSGLGDVFGSLLKGEVYPKSTATFDEQYHFDLGGGVDVRAIYVGPNHTHGDTIFVVQPDNVLFAGDVVMRGVLQVNTPDATVAHWLKSLDLISQLGPSIIVPDHGPIGNVGLIDGYRSYLTTLMKRAAELKHEGKSKEDAVNIMRTELSAVYDDGQYAGVWRWDDRMASSAELAYDEAK